MKGTTLAICLLTTAVAAEKTPSQFGVKSKVVGGRDWTPGRDYLPRSSAWELAADKFFAPLSRGGALGRNKEKEGASEEIIPPTRKRTITRKRRRRRRRIFQTAAVSGTFFLLAVYQLQQATKPQHKEWLIVERDYVGSMTISPQQQPSDDDQHYSSDPPLPSAPRYPRSTVAINNPDGASIPNEVFNLVKAIVGVGVLSLPAGTFVFNFSSLSNSEKSLSLCMRSHTSTWTTCILSFANTYDDSLLSSFFPLMMLPHLDCLHSFFRKYI